MTLPTSGEMTAAMINVEMGLPWNSPFSINSSFCRELAGKPTGEIKFSDFYGKTGAATYFSTMTVGFQQGDAFVPTRYGFYIKSLASNNGSYPAIGSLVPQNIPYSSSGAMPVDELSWVSTHYWLIFYVPAGQERNGTVQFMNMAGDVYATWDLPGSSGWISTTINGVAYRYTYHSDVRANPFPPVGQSFKLRFQP